MCTIISHFYNEEYLLPYWLDHHKRIFDNGIMINYGSTDDSVEIIKRICPGWTIIESRNEFFSAQDVDYEVMEIERSVSGWKMVLNITEHLIVDDLDKHLVGDACMITTNGVSVIGESKTPSILNIRNGVVSDSIRRNRKIHNFCDGAYTTGRHESSHPQKQSTMYTVWMGFYPWNDNTKKRKLQIQTRIPESDKIARLGYQHITTLDLLELEYINQLSNSKDLMLDESFSSVFSDMIKRYYE